MTGDEFVGVVFLAFGLIVVVFLLAVAFAPKGYQPPRPPRYRPAPPPAPPSFKDFGLEPGMISYAPPRVEVVDAAACEYCGRRAEFQAAPGVHRYRLGAATCEGCGAPAPAVVLQMAPPDPRALVNRVIR